MALLPKLPDDVKDDKQLMDFLRGITQVLDDNDADKLGGYHATTTPTANTIPVADSTGKLNSGWMDFTSIKWLNGYTKLPNGIIIQWGMVPVTSQGGIGIYTVPISFTISFPNRCFSLVTTAYCCDIPIANYAAFSYVGGLSKTGFTGTVYKYEYNGSFNIHWIAIGN